jgi:hypothetical protein
MISLMPPEQKNHFNLSTTLLGIAGLLVVVWGAYSYLQSKGFFKGGNNTISATASVVPTAPAADYSAVGQSTKIQDVSGAPAKTVPGAAVAIAPTLPYRATPFNGNAWIYDWGSASITNSALSFGAATSSTGGDLFLASSSAWTNYAVSANIDWQAGASFGIIARFFDAKDFVYCDFGNKTVSIVQRIDGVDAAVAQGVSANYGAGTMENLGISVYGNDVACTVGGAEALAVSITQNEPTTGGIGLISWDATPGVSKISVDHLSATALSADSIIAPFPAPAPVAPTATATATALTAATSTAPAAKLNLPYSETNFINDANWQATWGAVNIDSLNANAMDIGSAANTTGGTTILQNTNSWINYGFSATIDWSKGETFMVIGRYADADNYVACNFVRDPNNSGAATIELEKFVNGNETTIILRSCFRCRVRKRHALLIITQSQTPAVGLMPSVRSRAVLGSQHGIRRLITAKFPLSRFLSRQTINRT